MPSIWQFAIVFLSGLGYIAASECKCQSPREIADAAFRQLLGEYADDASRFFQDKTTRPLLLRQSNESSQAQKLFVWEDVEHLFNLSSTLQTDGKDYPRRLRPKARLKYGHDVQACRTRSPGGREAFQFDKEALVDGRTLKELYDDGWTILLKHPFEIYTPMYELAAMMEQHLLMTVAMYLFITPPGAQGFDFHSDSGFLMSKQLHGTKKWKTYPPLVEFPRRGIQTEQAQLRDLPEELQKQGLEFTVEQGDILTLPIGWHHTAEAVGEDASVHLAILLERVTWRETLESMNLEGIQMNFLAKTKLEDDATGGVALPFRRSVPRFMHMLPPFAMLAGMQRVLDEAQTPPIRSSVDLQQAIVDWRADFLANMTTEFLPPIGLIMPARREKPLPSLSMKEVNEQGLNSESDLQIVSTTAARVMNSLGKSRRGPHAVVKFSTGNAVVRLDRRFPNSWFVPPESAQGLRQVLHVELNPSGRFKPSDIFGVSSDVQLKLARDMVQRRIAVRHQDWLQMRNGQRDCQLCSR